MYEYDTGGYGSILNGSSCDYLATLVDYLQCVCVCILLQVIVLFEGILPRDSSFQSVASHLHSLPSIQVIGET